MTNATDDNAQLPKADKVEQAKKAKKKDATALGFNDRIAVRMSTALSSMWTFWSLTLLIGLALILQRPTGAQGWVLFVVSIFFQGVALPVLAFVSNQQGDRTEGILRETHDTVMKELEDLRVMHEERSQELAELRALHEEDRQWRERMETILGTKS